MRYWWSGKKTFIGTGTSSSKQREGFHIRKVSFSQRSNKMPSQTSRQNGSQIIRRIALGTTEPMHTHCARSTQTKGWHVDHKAGTLIITVKLWALRFWRPSRRRACDVCDSGNPLLATVRRDINRGILIEQMRITRRAGGCEEG